ncbi:MAG: S1 RNA-binding domain-containing protein, partial [Rhodospirillales bacterium]
RKSDLSRDRSEQRPDRFASGEKIDAKITQIDKTGRKLTLSIKAREVEEEKKAMAAYGSSDAGASLGDILGAAIQEKKKAAEKADPSMKKDDAEAKPAKKPAKKTAKKEDDAAAKKDKAAAKVPDRKTAKKADEKADEKAEEKADKKAPPKKKAAAGDDKKDAKKKAAAKPKKAEKK